MKKIEERNRIDHNAILDTDILIDAQRGYQNAVDFIQKLNTKRISIFSQFELVQGAPNKKAIEKVAKGLIVFNIIFTDSTIQMKGLEIYTQFKPKHGIGIIDSLIASTAITYNLVLVTKNTKHYDFIPELKLFKPYR